MKVIDLFAGCGGLSLGFIQGGYTVTRAVEFDAAIADTYKHNHVGVDVIVDDIKNVDRSGLFVEGEADVIIGGPPCQGFSMAGARIRQGFIDDPRNYLFKHYFNIVKTVKPRAFVIENVKGILTMQQGKIFEEILKSFSDEEILGDKPYKVNYKVVKASDFGVPQKRERVIIVGTKNSNYNFEDIWNKTKTDIASRNTTYFDEVTVKDAIGNLKDTNDDGCVPTPNPESSYQAYLASSNPIIHNHTQTKHSTIAIARMSQIANGENFTSLHEQIHSVHSGSYGRLSWNDQAVTITTRFDTPSAGRYIHPTLNRTLTPREAARLQSFPDDFVFYGNRTTICKEIGNAVPPKISFFLAKLIENILRG